MSVEQLRAATEYLAKSQPSRAPFTRINASLGGVPGAWIEAERSDRHSVIAYIHGGAFVAGSIDSHLPITAALSTAAQCRVWAIDYRLAPESPYPAARHDCQAALAALTADPDIKHLAIVADSAGSALALSVLMDARNERGSKVDAVVLICPWADLSCTAANDEGLEAGDPLLSQAFLKKMAGLYLAGHDPMDPSASPLYGDFADLPPLLIQTGTRDVLYADAIALERAALAADIDCILDVWPDMIHVWHAFGGLLPEARSALDQVGEFLQSVWDCS
ncbi:MAG: alpha/beta hydrolase [Pseudomonadota bacterium]